MISEEFQSWACPNCQTRLLFSASKALHCPSCDTSFRREEGIWRFLGQAQREHFHPFLKDYQLIREAEGRSSEDPSFYRLLPETDGSGSLREQWRIRAASYDAFVKWVLKPSKTVPGKALRIADLGAGNCWLSNRLSQLRQLSIPVDIRTDSRDGLGCHAFYEVPLSPIEASFSRLPFARESFDLAVFNAALHYAEDLEGTLRESLRVLMPGGAIVILDSPIYQEAESGQAMVREREEDFRRRFGTPSNHLDAEHFLTWQRLSNLAECLDLQWKFLQPGYGLAWRLRPLKVWWMRQREPAAFLLVVGTRRSAS